jgi:Cu/Ag efflux pump CusA
VRSGVKVFGPDLHELERLATEVERVVHNVPGTTSAFAERLEGGHYVEITRWSGNGSGAIAALPAWPVR